MKKSVMTLMMAMMLVLFLGGFAMAAAMDNSNEGSTESGKQCIQASRIDNVDVKDNQTIVFHMYNNKSFVNKLPFECPNLYHEGFSYNLQINKLCSTDIITVLNFPTKCGLGTFEPYTESATEDKDS
jgi:hypothetical protein